MAEAGATFADALGQEAVDPAFEAQEKAELGAAMTFAEADEPSPPRSFEEHARVFGRGAATGATITTSTVGLATLGGELGAMTGPAAPIMIPVGIGVGGAIGMILGMQATETMEPITYSNLEDIPPDLRPTAVAGEVMGGFVAPALAPVAIGQAGGRVAITAETGRIKTVAGGYLNKLLDVAAERPAMFLATETTAASGAALAEAGAETVFPGETGKRVIAGMGGGLLNPGRLITGTAQNMWQGLKALRGRFGQAGQQTAAGIPLQEWVQAEDPESMIKMIQEYADSLPEGVLPTAAQATGDPGLITFEAEFAELFRPFGADRVRAARDTLEALNVLVQTLRGTGDASAFREAARLQDNAVRALLRGQLDAAERTALKAAEGIAADTPEATRAISAAAEEAVGSSLRAARHVEQGLWDGIVSNVPMDTAGIFSRWSRELNKLLPDEVPELDPVITNTIDRIRDAKRFLANVNKRPPPTNPRELRELNKQVAAASKTLSSKNFVLLRRRLLARARDAAAQHDRLNAGIYGAMAEGTLDDLNKGFESAMERGLIDLGASQSYDNARRYSRELNDVYTRAFAGAAEAVDSLGGKRIPPEVMLDRALASGKTLGVLQFEELEAATRFLPSQAEQGVTIPANMLEEAAERTGTMLDAQARLWAITTANVVDASTGVVNVRQAEKLLRDQEIVFARFPEVRARLQGAIDAQNASKGAQTRFSSETARIESEEAFTQVLKVESPADAIAGALSSPNPLENLTNMAQLARDAGPRAIHGMRIAIWDDAIRSATRPDQSVSFQALSARLTQPIRPGMPSLLEIMHTERLMSLQDVSLVVSAIERGRVIGDALGTLPRGAPVLGGGVLDIPEMGMDLGLRILGAKGGAFLAGGSTGTTLLGAQRGSEAMRQVFQRIPQLQKKQIIADALTGAPLEEGGEAFGLLRVLMTVPESTGHGIQLARQVHAYALQANMLGLADQLPPREPEQMPTLREVMQEGGSFAGAGTEEPEGDQPGLISRAVSGVTKFFSGGEDQESITGGSGSDDLEGGAGADTLSDAPQPAPEKPTTPEEAATQQADDEFIADINEQAQNNPLAQLGFQSLGEDQITRMFPRVGSPGSETVGMFSPEGFSQHTIDRLGLEDEEFGGGPTDRTQPNVSIPISRDVSPEQFREIANHELTHAGINALRGAEGSEFIPPVGSKEGENLTILIAEEGGNDAAKQAAKDNLTAADRRRLAPIVTKLKALAEKELAGVGGGSGGGGGGGQ